MIASLPKIAVDVTSTPAPQEALTSSSAPTDKFSSVLSQAIHTTTASSAAVAPSRSKQEHDETNSSPEPSLSSSKLSPRTTDNPSTQKHSSGKSEDASKELVSQPGPTFSGDPKLALTIPKLNEIDAQPVTTTTDAKPDAVPITSTATSFAPIGAADFTFGNFSGFLSTSVTTSELNLNSASAVNVSGSQPEDLSPNAPEDPSLMNSKFTPDISPFGAPSTSTVSAGANIPDPTAARTSDNSGLTGDAKSGTDAPSIISQPHGEQMPQVPATFPSAKPPVVLPGNLQSIPQGTAKTTGKPEAAPTAHNSINDAASANPKPETPVAEASPHPTHKSGDPGESANQTLASTAHSILTKDVLAAQLTPPIAAPQLLDTKIETSSQAGGNAETANKPSAITPASSDGSTKTVVSGDDSKAQNNSSSNQQATSSAGAEAQLQNVAQQNVASKGADAFATNLTQPAPIAAHNRTEVNARSEVALDKTALHPSDSDIAGDKPGTTPAPNSLFQTAKLAERMGQSELRVGIQTGEFGHVDIRTSLARNQFTAEISVERGDLGKVMAAELPGLQTRLSEQRLPVPNIILQNQSSGGSAGFEQGSRQSQTMPQIATFHKADEETSPLPAATEPNLGTSRLDVHM